MAAEQGGPAAVRQAYVSLVSLFRASRREIAAQSPAAARGIRGAVTALGIAVRIGVPRQIKLASDVLQDAIDSQPAG